MKKHQELIPIEALPVAETCVVMFDQSVALLLEAGYVEIGLDHFAKPDDEFAIALREGRLERKFQGYTTDSADALIGMGISSISSLPNAYFQNISDQAKYHQLLDLGEFSISRGLALSQDNLIRRDIIMALMCNMCMNINAEQYPTEFAPLAPYLESGAAKYECGELIVNPNARKELRLVTSVFDSYMDGHNTDFRKPYEAA